MSFKIQENEIRNKIEEEIRKEYEEIVNRERIEIENEKVIKSRDGKLIFEPTTHTYFYDNKPLISVTQFIKLFTPDFDPLFPSINKAKSNQKQKSGITDPKKIRKYWRIQGERASSIGTATHAFAELYIMDRNIKPITPYEKAIISAIDYFEQEWEIYIQEELVYSTEYMLAGSIDKKLKHKKDNNRYAVVDWKITEDMFKYYDKMYMPFDKLQNNALNKYSIQLDLYTILSHEPISELDRYVIQLKSDGTFQIYSPREQNKYKLPYTMEYTKLAIQQFLKNNIKK